MIPERDQNNGKADKVRGIQGEGQFSSDTNSYRWDGLSSGVFRIEPIGSCGENWAGRIPTNSRSGNPSVLKKILCQLVVEHRNQIAMKLAEVERLEASASEYEQMIADIDAVASLSQK